MTSTARSGAKWGVVAVAALAALLLARPLGGIGMLVVLAAVLGIGLLAVNTPELSRPATVKNPDPLPAAKPRPVLSVRDRWQRGIEHHNQVLGAYGSFELDPKMLLQYPALWDLSAPQVIAFHDSLETAGELRSDEFPGEAMAEKYVAAVNELRSTWAAADRFARSTGTGALSADDARDCRRALKLLNHAESAENAERATYLQQVLGTVDRLAERGVVPRPDRARASLQTKIRRAIEA
ncbi:hypothetical protein [Gordonia phthalatica]|uniref:hypothetical protein n=1 Tax=Gordonia phthalatica TaxID=1136941 RepID=UPI000ADEE84F|nr:hypothetical protein [Gordonia phthalatica]